MCVYDFQVNHLRPLVAFVGAHGATDLATRHWPPVYAVCCLTPLPPKVVTALFVVASLAHFSEDGGADGSIALHSLAGGGAVFEATPTETKSRRLAPRLPI